MGPGAGGEAVRDLQHRLGALGYDLAGDAPSLFGPRTEAALAAFQGTRGLRVDGICGAQSWASLVEAGYRLGDRLLYHRSDPLRGDDVAELQRRLGQLGFDAGRVDGIFGVNAAEALADFQRNAGLTVDSILGPATRAELDRLHARSAGATSEAVAGVRERERLRRAPRTLAGRRVAVGEFGGLDALADAVARALAEGGAVPVVVTDPDGSTQAAAANAADVDLYLGFAGHATGCSAAYYATDGFSSAGGRKLAELVQARVPALLGVSGCGAVGMRLPVLRETRMTAVVCEVGPLAEVVAKGGALARAFSDAVSCWVDAPIEG